jgi:hypothetical protein
MKRTGRIIAAAVALAAVSIYTDWAQVASKATYPDAADAD